MQLAHRIEMVTTEEQARYCVQAAGTARFVWNFGLAKWNEQYELGGRPKASEIKRYFNSIKYERFPWIEAIHRDAHAQPFKNLGQAWHQHFESLKQLKRKEITASQLVGRPTFKKKTKCRDSFYVANDKLRLTPNGVVLPMIGEVKLTETLRFNGEVKSATVSREVDRWFISFSVDVGEPQSETPSGEVIGVDLGLKTFAHLSTGETIIAPKPLKRAQKRLGRLQRQEARRRKNHSGRHKKVVKAIAKLHVRIKNVRRDFTHKLTTRLAKNHKEICIEDLNVADMVKNHALAFHISDAAWGETGRQLEYKTKIYGSKLTVRDRFYPSSKLCSGCGYHYADLKLDEREWTCPQCGAHHDRDHNASKNLVSDPREKVTTAGRRDVMPWEMEALVCVVSDANETAVHDLGISNPQKEPHSHVLTF